MKYYLALYLFLSFLTLNAQDYQSSIYHAYVHEEMEKWKAIMEQMEQDYSENSDPILLYDLLEAEYGYTGWLVSVKRKKEAEEVLKSAQKHMALLTDLGLDDARVYSLKGAFYGFQIMLEPARAPKLGRLSMEANENALELDPGEPQVWLERANMDYYKPVIFGGSKKKAIPSYERAVKLFESSVGRSQGNWVYLNCMAALGIAYENTRKFSEAGKVYRKILELEPSFKWVKEELYPHFQQKHPEK